MMTKKILLTAILSFLIFSVMGNSALGYEIDSDGNYVLSAKEMAMLTKQAQINKLEKQRLEEKIAIYESSPVNEMVEKLISNYADLLEVKNLQIQTLTELNSTLVAENRSMEMELIGLKMKSTTYKVTSYTGWLVALGLGIGWAVD